MIIVQKVEILNPKLGAKLHCFLLAASSQNGVISVLLRSYVVVIYIYHFKRLVIMAPEKAVCFLIFIGIMTNSEMSDIRYLSPYPL